MGVVTPQRFGSPLRNQKLYLLVVIFAVSIVDEPQQISFIRGFIRETLFV